MSKPYVTNQLLTVLVDGGGIRGLSSLYILQNLMDKISRLEGRDGIKPYEYFDLIVGTSTGGWVYTTLDHFTC